MISIKNFVINLHPVIGSSDLWMPLHHKSLVILISPSLLIAIAFLFFMSVQAATNPQDGNALISLHSAWSQKPSSWDTSTDPCEDAWLGIRCDATNTRVTQLLLINQDLTGTLPSAIANLTDLTDLDLSSNPKLGGSLPKEIGNLKNLTRFYVQFCNFSGSIPSDIGNLTLLQHLGMTQNAFSGTLPDTIGLLKNLNWFDISSNQLSGFLPDSTTSASGSGLDSLTNAQHFHLENNSFSGSIPSSIFNSQMRLLHLLLHSNNLTGIIPTNIGDMPHVEIIRMDSNFLTGSVPSNLSIIQNLTTLQLNNNNLSGQLPDLSNNTNLQMLYLGNNQFDAAAIPSWISKLQKLYLLSMDSANLTGSIPADIFYSSTNISNVTLASNNLNGTLNLTLATSNLLIVNVTNNNLTALDNSNYTLELLLDGNPYCNSNPTECSTLQAGTSPPPPPPPSSTNASECSNVCQAQYAINTKASTGCQCARPVVGNVAFLATKIPLLVDYGISNVENLIASGLNTSSFLESLTFLDTQVVVDVISATQINVSVFPPSTTDAWSPSNAARISYVLKNQEIQFPGIGPIVCGFTGTPYDTVIVVNKLSTAAKIGIGIGVAVFVSAIVVLGVFAMQQRKRAQKAEKLNKPFASWIAGSDGQTADIPQLKGARWFSLDEIRKCTNNFSQNNEIGEGGYGKVYKGYLSSGERVAIKRAGAHSLQGATEFKNEIELLSRVHHRNLVGLIGFCFEEGEQMLVYEYMPNGTLRECLSGTTGIQMDWERRIALALHSARGIAYLHTEANPPIIHRDIKSTNILLDEKLVAKVADFGLSKLAPTEGAVNPVSTEVKGTLGYLDPDYFMTNRLTDKSDVYSFGVVLLEVVTARLPLRGTKYVVREVRTALAQGGMGSVVKSMVDPDLREYPPKALERLVELALACVEENPDARPTMAEVVKEIESLSEGPSVKMDERLGEKDGQVYEEELPFMKPKLGTPFEYSGSFVGMSTTMEPK